MLDTAIKTLRDENLTLCVVTSDQKVIKSKARGIYPLYNIAKNDIIALDGAVVADRVIGLAAAMLVKAGGIRALDTEVISESAVKILKQAGVVLSYRKRVPQIMNRQGDGRCPVETLATKAKDATELLLMIEGFLKDVGAIP